MKKRAKPREKADADGYSPEEGAALPCLEQGQVAKPTQLSPASNHCTQSGEAVTTQIHIFIHPEFPLSWIQGSPSLQLSIAMAPSIQTLLSPKPIPLQPAWIWAFLPSFSPCQHVQRGLLKCLLPFSTHAKQQPNLGWPQVVVQCEGKALRGASSKADPRQTASSLTTETSSLVLWVTTASADPSRSHQSHGDSAAGIECVQVPELPHCCRGQREKHKLK